MHFDYVHSAVYAVEMCPSVYVSVCRCVY